MFIRQYTKREHGRRAAYWALVESYRTERGPRQRVVAWLGKLDEAGRLGMREAAQALGQEDTQSSLTERTRQQLLFDDDQLEPRWVEVNARGVRVENSRQFGGPWLAIELIRRLQLDEFLERRLPTGNATIPWSLSSLILVIARLLEPSSELQTAEQWYPQTALPELLGVPQQHMDDNRLYRTLDQLLPHKAALEAHLKNRLGELFDLEYDLLLYDVTSTFFEGQANGNPLAQRGYSRDQRSDCKQVCIGLVVSRCGMPLGYEVFAGNTADVATVEHIVETMEQRYGQSDRIWVMDRGMVSEENIEFLKEEGRRYIIGATKSHLKKFEQQLLAEGWHTVHAGVEVKLCQSPDGDEETFILCRSRDRRQKDEAILRRFEQRIADRLKSMQSRCEKQNRNVQKVEREVGRLLGQNTRAAGLFEVEVKPDEQGFAQLSWKKIADRQDWATLSAGCYLLRSNVRDWSDEDLWKAYIQLTEAEAAFRIHKSDLSIRPIWHQKEDRVRAHILVCFLAYVLWKTLAALCQRAGLGHEPRRVLAELSDIRLVDVVLPTKTGIDLRTRCICKPTDHQQILLDHLGLRLPSKIKFAEM
jgi:transposase